MKDFRISYKAARINCKMNLMKAANEIGVTVHTLINYESGRTVPNWDKHEKMADVYKIPKENLCPPKK